MCLKPMGVLCAGSPVGSLDGNRDAHDLGAGTDEKEHA